MESIEDFNKKLRERNFKPLTNEEIKFTNESPEAKATGIKVIKRNNDRWKTILSWGFIIFVLSVAVFVYLVYEGKVNLVNLGLLSIPSCICPNCPANPSCPICPDNICSLSCSACPSCNPILNCGNSS